MIIFIIPILIVIMFLHLLSVYYYKSNKYYREPSEPESTKVDCNSCEIDISKLTPEQTKSIISSNVTLGKG